MHKLTSKEYHTHTSVLPGNFKLLISRFTVNMKYKAVKCAALSNVIL